MYRGKINKYIKKSLLSWLLARIVLVFIYTAVYDGK